MSHIEHSPPDFPHDENIHSAAAAEHSSDQLGHEHTHIHGSHSHTHTNTKAVLNRLARAIGHLGSVKKMVENGRDCSEVLIQLSAVRSAINGICELILSDHIDHCLVDAVETGDTETIAELNKAIRLLLK